MAVNIKDLMDFNPLYSNPVDFEQVGGQAQPVREVPSYGGDPIVVTANQRDAPNVDMQGPEAPFMGNREYLDEALMSLEDAPQRKGMFGVKGTLRDILGTVGDALLEGNGRNAVYRPGREREKVGDAMSGWTNGVEAAKAAAERLTAMGRPEEARELLQQITNEELKRSQIDGLQASRESQAQDRKWGNVKDATNMIARIFADPRAQANPALAMAQAEVIARQAGVSLEELGLSQDMSPEELGLYSRRDMTVNQQEMLPRRDRQLDQGDRRLNISQQNADRPRAGPRPAQPTEAGEISRIRGMVNRGEKLPPGDQATWNAYQNKSSGSGRSRSSSRSNRRPVSQSRFR